MLEASYGINFFLKRPKSQSDFRYVYIRITVDRLPKEVSTKRKWYASKWNQRSERATGSKEDAKALNNFLDSIRRKVEDYKIQLINRNTPITSQKLIDFVLGNTEANTHVNVVKEMLGHQSIKQTEEYALTEQTTISREMDILDSKISSEADKDQHSPILILERIEDELNLLKVKSKNKENSEIISQLQKYQKK